MSKLAGEFTNHYIGEVLSWREYVTNLDLSHWSWVNCSPADDRQVIELGGNLLAVPVYPRDIYEDPDVSVVELPNHLLAVSWDNFHYDATVVRDVDTGEPVGWLLVEELNDHEYKIAYGCGCPFDSLEEIKDFLKEEQEDIL